MTCETSIISFDTASASASAINMEFVVEAGVIALDRHRQRFLSQAGHCASVAKRDYVRGACLILTPFQIKLTNNLGWREYVIRLVMKRKRFYESRKIKVTNNLFRTERVCHSATNEKKKKSST